MLAGPDGGADRDTTLTDDGLKGEHCDVLTVTTLMQISLWLDPQLQPFVLQMQNP